MECDKDVTRWLVPTVPTYLISYSTYLYHISHARKRHPPVICHVQASRPANLSRKKEASGGPHATCHPSQGLFENGSWLLLMAHVGQYHPHFFVWSGTRLKCRCLRLILQKRGRCIDPFCSVSLCFAWGGVVVAVLLLLFSCVSCSVQGDHGSTSMRKDQQKRVQIQCLHCAEAATGFTGRGTHEKIRARSTSRSVKAVLDGFATSARQKRCCLYNSTCRYLDHTLVFKWPSV